MNAANQDRAARVFGCGHPGALALALLVAVQAPDAAAAPPPDGSDAYAQGLALAADWVARAERGDLTPVRAESRSVPELFSGSLTPELAFDQPRSVVVSTTPRVATRPLTTALVNPARALIESGIPSSVVVGQRLRRTRIIGNPGTGGQIRVNPNVEPLIRLPR